ncbi:transcriptional regulator, TetR family [Nocardia amikacinitolerans]|uniref:TetR/AcrR family transcriptional regulator n=1 Tax=Nocardia amikacinitolerans TaxID=756689 RepID=UPI0020A26FF3|nr:TetR family transcriptional regulator [Nocardia amikacinitolerans]MCP2299108.1 transcriptional regulator, TetR family [Nocardia amikacinitolerans]
MSTTDRRTLIVDAAIELIARRGLRALTHRALDTELGLPPGSSSYYFRTKRALIEAIADRISSRSRSDFVAAKFDVPETTDLPSIANGIAVWLDRLLLERRDHLIARHALIIDLIGDPELHPRLANSLFSVERARELFRATGFPDPDTAAADFVAILEGAVFDRFAGNRSALPAGTPASITQLTTLLSAYLRR